MQGWQIPLKEETFDEESAILGSKLKSAFKVFGRNKSPEINGLPVQAFQAINWLYQNPNNMLMNLETNNAHRFEKCSLHSSPIERRHWRLLSLHWFHMQEKWWSVFYHMWGENAKWSSWFRKRGCNDDHAANVC